MKAKKKLKAGTPVYITSKGYLKPCKPDKFVVAIAAHDINKGDIIEYCPTENTKDFIVQGRAIITALYAIKDSNSAH